MEKKVKKQMSEVEKFKIQLFLYLNNLHEDSFENEKFLLENISDVSDSVDSLSKEFKDRPRYDLTKMENSLSEIKKIAELESKKEIIFDTKKIEEILLSIEKKDIEIPAFPDKIKIDGIEAIEDHLKGLDFDTEPLIKEIRKVSESMIGLGQLEIISKQLSTMGDVISEEKSVSISDSQFSDLIKSIEKVSDSVKKIKTGRGISVGGGGNSYLKDSSGNVVNPATSDKQDEIIAALGGTPDSGPKRILALPDSGNNVILYIGKAPSGSLTSDPVWQIQRLDESIGFDRTWANGNREANNIYDNRESLTYE